jgi:hypothetical protein
MHEVPAEAHHVMESNFCAAGSTGSCRSSPLPCVNAIDQLNRRKVPAKTHHSSAVPAKAHHRFFWFPQKLTLGCFSVPAKAHLGSRIHSPRFPQNLTIGAQGSCRSSPWFLRKLTLVPAEAHPTGRKPAPVLGLAALNLYLRF